MKTIIQIVLSLTATICVAETNEIHPNKILRSNPHKDNNDFSNLQVPKDLLQGLYETHENDLLDNSSKTAIINEYSDKILKNMEKLIVKAGLDPVATPDAETKFQHKIMFITYSGDMKLANGRLRGLSSLRRTGDVSVAYVAGETKRITCTIPVGFDLLAFNYDYAVKFMGLGPAGGLTGKMVNRKRAGRLAAELAVGHCSHAPQGHVGDVHRGGRQRHAAFVY